MTEKWKMWSFSLSNLWTNQFPEKWINIKFNNSPNYGHFRSLSLECLFSISGISGMSTPYNLQNEIQKSGFPCDLPDVERVVLTLHSGSWVFSKYCSFITIISWWIDVVSRLWVPQGLKSRLQYRRSTGIIELNGYLSTETHMHHTVEILKTGKKDLLWNKSQQ